LELVRARLLIATLAAAALLGCTAVPVARAVTPGELAAFKIYKDYLKNGGKINPCDFSSEDLKLALNAIPPDVRQYASDLPGAIKAAIAARARGECANGATAAPVAPAATSSPGGSSAPAPTPPPTPTEIPTKTVVPDPPAPATGGPATPASSDSALERAASASPAGDAPAPLVMLGVLAAVFTLFALVLVAMRRLGWAEGRLAPVAHSWREAAWRFGGTWEDFRDWVRVGR